MQGCTLLFRGNAAAYSGNILVVFASLSHRCASFRAFLKWVKQTVHDHLHSDWPSQPGAAAVEVCQFVMQMQTAGEVLKHAARPFQKELNSIKPIGVCGLKPDCNQRGEICMSTVNWRQIWTFNCSFKTYSS